ncbi:MAG: BTAD domain-containing putative transcriptional regulator [Thermoanaerobaculia bacterium]
MGLVERPPQLRRVSERLALLPGPRIELWSWPGSGAPELLSALAQDRRGVFLDAETRVPWLRGQESELWLWQPASPPPPEVLSRLPTGARLVYVSARRSHEPAVSALHCSELLLSEGEVSSLAQALTPEGVSAELLRRLRWATDGWLEPLALALVAGAGRGRLDPTPAALLSIPAVRTFLRTEVWEGLSEALRELLLDLSVINAVDPALWAELWQRQPERKAALSELVDELGLWVEEPSGRRRLPHLLQAFVAVERDRSRAPARVFAQGQRLALAAYGRGESALALTALVTAGDPARLSQLLELDWLPLFLTADLPTLRAALRLARVKPGSGAEFLRLAAEAVVGDRRRVLAGLAELAARSGQDPALAAASRLALAAVRSVRSAPEVAALARRELAGLAPEPAALETLITAVEGLSREGSAPPLPAAPLVAHLAAFATSGLLRLSPDSFSAASFRGPQEEAAQAFHVRFFGSPVVFRLEGGSRQELSWTLKRALKTFAFLASQPERAAGRNQLIEAVWGNEPEESIAGNFHPTLTHLRRTLAGKESGEQALLFQGGIYRLNPALDWHIDIVEFESLSQRGRGRLAAGDAEGAIELWQAAWRLYSGPFLDGFDEAWVFARRELLERAYLQLLQGLGDLYLERGEAATALDAYRAALAADPLQERVHLAVMQIYARQARRDLVRSQYDRLSSILRQELGVEPLPETSAEFHRLMG